MTRPIVEDCSLERKRSRCGFQRRKAAGCRGTVHDRLGYFAIVRGLYLPQSFVTQGIAPGLHRLPVASEGFSLLLVPLEQSPPGPGSDAQVDEISAIASRLRTNHLARSSRPAQFVASGSRGPVPVLQQRGQSCKTTIQTQTGPAVADAASTRIATGTRPVPLAGGWLSRSDPGLACARPWRRRSHHQDQGQTRGRLACLEIGRGRQ